MTLHRAYSVLEVKSVDDDKRELTGMATTVTADRMADVVEPKGAQFKLPMPFLWQHDSEQPIGHVTSAKVTKAGIEVKARIAKTDVPGRLKDRLDEAWHSIKLGLVRGLSIGFQPTESSILEDTGGIHFLKWLWLELSAVTIPANAEANILTVKNHDTMRAPLGRTHRVVKLDPIPATVVAPKKAEEAIPMINVSEQITASENKRAALAARLEALMTKAAEAGTTLEGDDEVEYDNTKADVASLDKHLVRLHELETTQAHKAKPVTSVKRLEDGAQARGDKSPVIFVKGPELPKATAFVRYVKAMAMAKGNLVQAVEISKQWHDSTPEVEIVLKAAMTAGTTLDSDWAAPLVPYQQMVSEFLEFLRPATIIGRLPGLRHVPFNVRIPSQTQGSTVAWVGEGAPKPISELKFVDTTLRFAKCAGIVVISDELARMSTPSAEAVIRTDLTDQIAQFLDVAFVDPAKAAVANVNPASITNGLTPTAATGTTAAFLRADIATLFGGYITNNLSAEGAVFITTPAVALSIGLMQNPLGQPEHPGLNLSGGTLFGLPVITSNSVPVGLLIIAKTSEILVADDGGVAIDVSREASLQMDSAPDNPGTATTVLVSLWQQNLVGIRAERMINWAKRRAAAVALISGAAYV